MQCVYMHACVLCAAVTVFLQLPYVLVWVILLSDLFCAALFGDFTCCVYLTEHVLVRAVIFNDDIFVNDAFAASVSPE